MSVRVRDALMRSLGELRHEPSNKRVRAMLGGQTVVDSTRAVLVWEPRRVVASFAVPLADVHADVVTTPPAPPGQSAQAVGLHLPDLTSLPVLDPRIPFAVHTADGESVSVQVAAGAAVEGYRPADPDLADYVILDFSGFDAWYEEDEAIVSHPRDPFHRIDVLRSSRAVRIELDGHVLAESNRAHLLFETMLPVRYYIPPEDVHVDLHPSSTRSYCAYKGEASYRSPQIGDRVVEDLVWTYPAPLHEAEAVRDLFAFFDEHTDLVVDGERRERPVTPWS